MSGRVFLYVQHLLGIGHLKRAAALSDAMTRAGMHVTVASGGPAVPGLVINAARIVQLPAVASADSSFKSLIDESGQPIDEAWKARRRDRLLEAWHSAEADALVIELFPFGRRQMRFELIPLLQAARAAARPGKPRPVIVSSVRDMLGGGAKSPARQDAMLEAFDRYFDFLMIHGDPQIVDFGDTFRHAGRLGAKVHYTGYVVDAERAVTAAGADVGRDEVLVSAGGGAVGAQLMETAIRARPLGSQALRTWRLLTGVNAEAGQVRSIRELAARHGDGRVVVERSRTDFTRMLANCAVSVSQGGYNTVMETLRAGARSVVVPFVTSTENEQTLRARLLQQRGLLVLCEQSDLSPSTLAAAIDRAASMPRPRDCPLDLDGASHSAALLQAWIKDRQC